MIHCTHDSGDRTGRGFGRIPAERQAERGFQMVVCDGCGGNGTERSTRLSERKTIMQRGAIKKHGKFWVLKYREDVLQNGVRVRKEVYKKLAPANSREYQTKESVQKLADVILAPLNAGL